MQLQSFSSCYMRLRTSERRRSFSVSQPASPFVENLMKSTNLLIHISTLIERANSSQRAQHQLPINRRNISQRVNLQSTSRRPASIEPSSSKKKKKRIPASNRYYKKCIDSQNEVKDSLNEVKSRLESLENVTNSKEIEYKDSLNEVKNRLESLEKAENSKEIFELEMAFDKLKPSMRMEIKDSIRNDQEGFIQTVIQYKKKGALEFLKRGDNKNLMLGNHYEFLSQTNERLNQIQEAKVNRERLTSQMSELLRKNAEKDRTIEALANQNDGLKLQFERLSKSSKQFQKRCKNVQVNYIEEDQNEEDYEEYQ